LQHRHLSFAPDPQPFYYASHPCRTDTITD
jgi:hypothetical protein